MTECPPETVDELEYEKNVHIFCEIYARACMPFLYLEFMI